MEEAQEESQNLPRSIPDILPKILGNVVEHVFRWEEAFLTAHAEECASRGSEMGLSLF